MLKTMLQASPIPTPSDRLPSTELGWDSGSRDRKVPSSETWDFSVSLSMPGWDTGGREEHATMLILAPEVVCALPSYSHLQLFLS